MKVLLSPDFNEKIPALDADTVSAISQFVLSAENLDRNEFVSKNIKTISNLDGEVYNAKINSSQIYFTIGNDEQGDYLLLLDVATIKPISSKGESFFTVNNPKTNRAFDPRYNSSINPKLNSSINPKFNSSINPKFNSSINPKFNSSINPRFNSSINPSFNTSINPKFNSSINPKLNSSLNPRKNRSYGGPYLYGIDLNQQAYLVRANNKVEILYDPDGAFYGFLVDANGSVKVEYNKDNVWTGYCVKANDKVWLRYSVDNEWQGLFV
ncbi:hypothetical protein [Pseudomonas fluorescens]|uniref:hypothetical protein n=1 Tax=Pseudomonas fluorescens TaxID=294 RepID=UPI00125BF115|nr:hypothetical protein [Pseudomonas fluorescens]VVQ02487.1 hypothetical protein PS906_05144 [Pseudomonas fluorescens]